MNHMVKEIFYVGFDLCLAVGASFFGDILQPQGGANGTGANGSSSGNGAQAQKIVSGDLDASLANLTSNLNLTTGQSK